MKRILNALFLATALLAACGGGSSKSKTGDGKDCAAVVTCASKCTTETCVNSCTNGISNETKQELSDLVTCANQSGCQNDACLWQNCEGEMKTCGLKQQTGVDGTAGLQSLPEVSVE